MKKGQKIEQEKKNAHRSISGHLKKKGKKRDFFSLLSNPKMNAV